MKALKYFSFAVILISILLGCKKTEEEIVPTLSINPAQKDIEANQGSFVIAVASTVKWTASSDKSWLTLNPVSGNGDATIQVDYQLNNSAANRTAIITFKGTNIEDKVLTVTQLGIQPILTVSPANLSVAADAGNAVINITSNLSWTVTSNQTWCTLAQSSGIGNAALTINYQPNTVQSQRSAIITFAANGVTNQTVQVTQAEFVPVLSVTPPSQTVNSPSGTATYTITSNISWTAACAESWCTIANPGGTNNGTLSVIYNENTTSGPRVATITVSGTGVANQSVTLTQTNLIPTLSVAPSNRDVASSAGNTTFEITSNTSWAAESNQTWCSIQNTTGTGNTTLNVNFEENTSNDQRVATITLSGNGVASQTATVTQQSAIPTDGLVAWYPFNGNANDESGNGNNGSVFGANLTNSRNGNANGAYFFNGINYYIEIPNSSSISFGNNVFTIAVWIKTSMVNFDPERYPMIISKNSPYPNRYGYDIWTTGISSGHVYFETHADGSQASIGSGFDINDNQWHFLVGIRNGTSLSFYIDNELVGSNSFNGSSYNTYSLYIGGLALFNYANFYYEGVIDDVRLYNRVLTEQEIQQLYNE